MALHEVGQYEIAPAHNLVVTTYVPNEESIDAAYSMPTTLWMARQIVPHLEGPNEYGAVSLAERMANRSGFYVASLIKVKEPSSRHTVNPLAFAEVEFGKVGVEFKQLGVVRSKDLSPQYFDGVGAILDTVLSRQKRETLCVVHGYPGDSRMEGLLEEIGLVESPGSPPWGVAGAVLLQASGVILDKLESYTSFRTMLPESLTMEEFGLPGDAIETS